MPHRHPAVQCIVMLFYHGSNNFVIVGVICFSGFMDRPIFILKPLATQCQIADDKAYLTRFECDTRVTVCGKHVQGSGSGGGGGCSGVGNVK